VPRVIPAGPLPLPLKLILAVEILCAYLTARRRLRAGDLRGAVVAIRRSAGRSMPDGGTGWPEARVTAARLANAVQRTARVLPRDARCLTQALVLSSLLDARGIPSTLVIGARSEGGFAAHAWVEHEGRPLLPSRGFDSHRLIEM
jgi:hypothetical protein